MRVIIALIALIGFMVSVSDPETPGNEYCAKLKDGKIVMIYQGVILTRDVTLDNGTQIKTDGTVIKKDGSKTVLKEGECIGKGEENVPERKAQNESPQKIIP